MPALRLGHKLFLAFGLIIVVVALLVGWNLLATDRLTRETRTIVERALPAARLEVMILEAVIALRRLEARYAVLRDPAYLRIFRERVASIDADLQRLDRLLSTPDEHETLAQARAYLADYGRLGERGAPVPPVGALAHIPLEVALERLYAESESELRGRQAAAHTLNETSRLIALAGLAASVVLGLSVSLFALWRIARPLRRLRAAAEEVARRDFSRPIPVLGRDEVADLALAFNQMAAKLGELDALKAEFFAAISHDLRTPLAAIRLSADLLHREVTWALDTRQRQQVERIRASSVRLIGLVNQLIDLGSLRAGKLRLDLEQADLRDVVARSVEEVRPLAEQRKLQLEVAIPETVPAVPVDVRRIQQVLVNLLGNSIRFTREGGRVSASAEREGTAVVVKVKDTGIGIPSHLVAQVFEPYEQAHRGQGGTGIGLAVVKGLVEAHGGRVWVESEEGRGSCFTFTLPLERRAG